MLPMNFPILNILRSQVLILNNQQILSVSVLRRFGEIEASSDRDLAVNYNDLVMSNVMSQIYLGGNSCFGHKRPRGMRSTTLLGSSR